MMLDVEEQFHPSLAEASIAKEGFFDCDGFTPPGGKSPRSPPITTISKIPLVATKKHDIFSGSRYSTPLLGHIFSDFKFPYYYPLFYLNLFNGKNSAFL